MMSWNDDGDKSEPTVALCVRWAGRVSLGLCVDMEQLATGLTLCMHDCSRDHPFAPARLFILCLQRPLARAPSGWCLETADEAESDWNGDRIEGWLGLASPHAGRQYADRMALAVHGVVVALH